MTKQRTIGGIRRPLGYSRNKLIVLKTMGVGRMFVRLVAFTEDGEEWYDLTPSQARKLAAALTEIADDVKGR